MYINDYKVREKLFAYDGCHKIYLAPDVKTAKELGYQVLPISKLRETYENSCPLRFINSWRDLKTIAAQGEEVTFKDELKAVFRIKNGIVEMFYYDKDLICFCMEEGHSIASYEYYRSTKPLPESMEKFKQDIIRYYESDGEIKIRVMKKLSRNQ